MTTQLVKTYNPSGSGANNFTTVADAMAWVRSFDPVGTDTNANLILYADVTWAQDTAPLSSSNTQRLTVSPAAGAGVNDINRGAFNNGSGITVIFRRVQYSLQISAGVDFVNLNITIGEAGQTSTILFKNHASGNTFDNQILYCRILDQSTSGGQSFSVGNANNLFRVADSLIITEKSDYVFRTITGGNRFERNTVVGRNAGSGTSALVISNYGGDTIVDNVLINTGDMAIANTGSNSFSNNFSNTGTTKAGLTVVTGAGVLVVNELNDFTPTANGPLIGAGSAASKGTPDILGGNRGSAPDVGARMRVAAAPVPAATITNIVVSTTTGNKRKITISGTTTGTPTSGLLSITPTSKTGNNGVAQSSIAFTPSGGTFTVSTSDDTRVGQYNPTVTVTNNGGSSAATGGSTIDVVGATGVITSQPNPNGQYVSISGTTTGSPDSGSITWPADPNSVDSNSQGPFALTLGSGTFSDLNRSLPAGMYLAPIVTFTMAAGTSFPATGGSALFINGISGNPQAPELGTPTTPTPGDTSPPTLTSPTGVSSGTTTAMVGVTTNEANGTLYALVNTSATATVAQIKGGLSQVVTNAGSKSFTVTGLVQNTTYYAHFVHVDAATNESAVIDSAAFITQSNPTTPVPAKIVYLVNGRLRVSNS